ncbi:MAG: hypothetical protein HQL86_07495 [Magnetococcales bacterium]|nr:hypothetical protein [Magnetococcales bacterium]
MEEKVKWVPVAKPRIAEVVEEFGIALDKAIEESQDKRLDVAKLDYLIGQRLTLTSAAWIIRRYGLFNAMYNLAQVWEFGRTKHERYGWRTYDRVKLWDKVWRHACEWDNAMSDEDTGLDPLWHLLFNLLALSWQNMHSATAPVETPEVKVCGMCALFRYKRKGGVNGLCFDGAVPFGKCTLNYTQACDKFEEYSDGK